MNENNPVLHQFIDYLLELIKENYGNVYNIVKANGVQPKSNILVTLLARQSFYLDLRKDFRTGKCTPRDWIDHSTQHIAFITSSLLKLSEKDLEEGVLDNFIREKEETQKTVSDIETDLILVENSIGLERKITYKKRIILNKIDITEIIIPISNEILTTPDKRYEFKKRMTYIQNYLTLESYGKALEECEYILKNLELESGQLHEYHAISYFKAKGSEYGIIQDIQNEKEDTLKQLTLYVQRCLLFNKDKDKTLDSATTVTFEDKIAFMCYRMSLVLREYYRSAPEYNYINHGDNKDLRNLISRYIKTGLFLMTELQSLSSTKTTLFIEDALIELNGGRRLEWLEVTEGWQIRNRDNYPALEIRDEIINILNKTNAWETCRKRLYKNLTIKYSRIKTANRPLEARHALRRFFKTSVIAYKCFDRDTRFLELLKDELLHLGKLDWFELDVSDRIIPNAECYAMGYDPRKDLDRCRDAFSQSSSFQKDITAFYAELKRQKEIKRIEEQVAAVDVQYEELRRNSTNRDIDFREQVVKCLELWQQAYEQVKFDRFINRVIKELIGKEGILFWFQLNDNAELINHAESTQLGFDAVYYLNDALDKSADYYTIKEAVWKDIRQEAAQIMEQEANSKYQQL